MSVTTILVSEYEFSKMLHHASSEIPDHHRRSVM